MSYRLYFENKYIFYKKLLLEILKKIYALHLFSFYSLY